jgi:stage II sporulation SpoE-like protein
MIAELHWSTTPLGSITDWQQSLRTAVGICLASRHPMVIWWGPEYLSAHRDAAVARLTGRLAGASDSDGVLSAGHLPAIVARASGGTELLDDARGVPLATADVTGPEAGALLGRGDTVLLYTDGLVERRRCFLTTALIVPARSLPKLTTLLPPRSLSGSPSNCWATVTMTTSPT